MTFPRLWMNFYKLDMESSTCSRSSEYNSGYSCYKAMDGDLTTVWATRGQAVGAWIQINFDDTYQISKMLIMHRLYDKILKDITLEFSSGSPAYSTLRDFSDIPRYDQYSWNEVDIPGKRKTNFVKATATSANSGGDLGFREIVIFGGSLPGIFCKLSNNTS